MKRTIIFFSLLFIVTGYCTAQNLVWQQRGQQTGGASTFAWNNDKTKLYKGTYWTGVHMSLDSGLTWNNIYPGITTGGVYSITMKKDTLYAEFSGCGIGGVRYTANDGLTWTRIDTISFSLPNTYEISSNNSTVFVAGYDNISQTSDNGATWQVYPSPNPSMHIFTVDATDSLVCAVGWNGIVKNIFVSQDNGTTWNTHNHYAGVASWGLRINNNNIFMGTIHGLHRSSDFGNTWTNLGLLGENLIALRFFGQYGFIASANNTYPDSYVHFSSDGGNTWTMQSTGLPNDPEILDFAIFDSTVIAGGWGTGIWSTDISAIASGTLESKNQEFNIFPNPAHENVAITFPEGMKKESTTIKILNLSGVCIMNTHFENNLLAKLDISNIAQGVYFVSITDGMKSVTSKLLVY